jgi:hypothetical protein
VADCEALLLPISFEKSQLVPLKRVVFCGFLLDFTTGLVHVPREKAAGILPPALWLMAGRRLAAACC